MPQNVCTFLLHGTTASANIHLHVQMQMLQLWDHNNGTKVFQQDSAQLNLYIAVHTYLYTVFPSKWTQFAWPMPWPPHFWDLITFYFCVRIHEGCGVLYIPPGPTASMSCSSASQTQSPRCTRKCYAKYRNNHTTNGTSAWYTCKLMVFPLVV